MHLRRLGVGLATLLLAARSHAAGATTRYPAGARHSPLTADIVERLRAVLARGSGRKDVFSKIGDSITVNAGFLGCFASPATFDLGDHATLKPTVDFFSQTKPDENHESWNRLTLAAHVGWTSLAALGGGGNAAGSPLLSELQVAKPGFAIVMLGTNETFPGTFPIYEHNLRRVVEAVLDEGVVPLLSTIPPRRDNPNLDKIIPEMNTVVRGLAEAERIPLMDFWGSVKSLPGYGLTKDGVHPQSQGGGACRLTTDGLTGGVNQRNLVTLESLDRMRRFVLGKDDPEAPPAVVSGAGTIDDPRVVDALPFVDEGVTDDGAGALDGYSCGRRPEGGKEVIYVITLPTAARVRAHLFSEGTADHDAYFLSAPAASACLARGDRGAVADLPAGKSYFVVDTFSSRGAFHAGSFHVTLDVVPGE